MAARVLPISMVSSVALASLAPARKVLLNGDLAHSVVLQLIARAACEKRKVVFICGDNRFDPYAVSRFAKSNGVSADDVLRRILIARAFTAYQFVEMITRLSPGSSQDLVVVSGPCSAFLDEDVPYVDAARLFYRVLWKIVELAREGMMLLLVQPEPSKTWRRNYFLADLRRSSDIVLRLGGEHSFTIERHGRISMPQVPGLERLLEE
jgi:hypothetical protein